MKYVPVQGQVRVPAVTGRSDIGWGDNMIISELATTHSQNRSAQSAIMKPCQWKGIFNHHSSLLRMA
jgi:hypothetical protein